MDDSDGKKDVARPARQQFSARVRIGVQGVDTIQERFASNLSDGGLFIRDDNPPAVGTRVLVEFVLPDSSTLSRVVGEVIHSRPSSSLQQGNSGMGLRFIHYDDTAKGIADRFAEIRGPRRKSDEQETAPATQQELLRPLERSPFVSVEGPVVGIDLGTVNSCVSVITDNGAEVVTSRRGYQTIPSTIHLAEDGGISVGHQAVERMILEPHRAVYGSKRFLGRPFNSKEVLSLAHFFSYQVVPYVDGFAAARIGDRLLPLTEVAAYILRELKEMAEEHLEERVTRALITVPAYFGESQRRAIRDAGRMAGLYVERVVNEPTAAAVAFGYGRGLERTVFVYDLGGGTFDASVLSVQSDRMEVLASDGDPFLGGVDFDDRITEFVLTLVEREHEIDLRDNPVSIQRTRFAVEMAKKQLSETEVTEIDLPYLAEKAEGTVDFRCMIDRDMIESLTQDLVDRTLKIVDSVLSEANLAAEQIDDILLVGGQTRSPHVRRLLMERFNKKPVSRVHPDEAVAIGAGLVGKAMYGEIPVQLIDILPADIRLATDDDTTELLVARGTKLPVEQLIPLSAPSGGGDQTLKLLRGDHEGASKNTMLGQLVVPESAFSEETPKLTLSLSDDGIMTMFLQHSGRSEELEVSLLDD